MGMGDVIVCHVSHCLSLIVFFSLLSVIVVCNCMLLSVIVYPLQSVIIFHYLSLSANVVCNNMSLYDYVIACPLSDIILHYLSLPVNVCNCLSLSFTVYLCLALPVIASH